MRIDGTNSPMSIFEACREPPVKDSMLERDVGMLPSLVCVPMGRLLHATTLASYPAVDLAPVVAAAIVAGRSIDLSRIDDGVLPVSLAAEAAGTAEARALAWLGRLTFVGIAEGLEKLVATLSEPGRAESYLARRKRCTELERRHQKYIEIAADLRSAKSAECYEYGHLFFPDTEETVPSNRILDYLRERRGEQDRIPPFGFAVSLMEWVGISEADLRIELDRHGRTGFDLEAVISRSLIDFGAGAREDLVNERRLWRIVGRWLESSGPDASMTLVVDLSRWNAMQRVRSVRILRDVIVPTCEPIDPKMAMRWCRERAEVIRREIQQVAEGWTAS